MECKNDEVNPSSKNKEVDWDFLDKILFPCLSNDNEGDS